MDSDDRLLRCYRYTELNLVRAATTNDPGASRWPSCQVGLGLRPRSGLQPHPGLLALGADIETRAAALDAGLSLAELATIRTTLQQHALGTRAFQAMVQAKTQRFAGVRAAHRKEEHNGQREVNLTLLAACVSSPT